MIGTPLLFLAVSMAGFGIMPAGPLYAADEAVVDHKEDKDGDEDESFGFIPLVIPFYTPETRFGIGIGIVMYNHPDGDMSLEPDSLEMEGIGTLNKQFELNFRGTKYLSRDLFQIGIEGEVNKWPDEFYGIGNSVKEKNKEEYSQSGIDLKGLFLVKTISKLYIGPMIRYNRYAMKEREKGGLLESNLIRGSDGTQSSGAGIALEYDATAGPEFFPRTGVSVEAEMAFYRKELGSEYNFSNWVMNYKRYFNITGDHVIAFDGYISSIHGDAPWQMLNELGGQERMRGYIGGMYRDKRYAALQGEYRFPIAWRFAGAVFGGAGEVAESFRNFRRKDVRLSCGGGIRFILDEKEHVPLRLDAAVVPETGEIGVYFGLLEAF
jgi:hypothetical protein